MKPLIALLSLSAGALWSYKSLVIDDFTSADGSSQVGGYWQGFTDRVMGGRSDIQAGIIELDGRRVLRMEGDVTLENNGGFVQVRLPLDSGRNGISPENYRGIRIRYSVNRGSGFYVHLRTTGNRLPWAYFGALIPDAQAGAGEQVAEIPWEAFKGEMTALKRLRPANLSSIAVVAAYEPGRVSIDVFHIELY
jgi:hypothetical protein